MLSVSRQLRRVGRFDTRRETLAGCSLAMGDSRYMRLPDVEGANVPLANHAEREFGRLVGVCIDVLLVPFPADVLPVDNLITAKHTTRFTELSLVRERTTWSRTAPCVEGSWAVLREVGRHSG